jgi:hypothetical protein
MACGLVMSNGAMANFLNSLPNHISMAGLSRKKGDGLLKQVWGFLKVRKAWWLLPLIVMTLLLGVLIFVASSSKVSVFVYTLI